MILFLLENWLIQPIRSTGYLGTLKNLSRSRKSWSQFQNSRWCWKSKSRRSFCDTVPLNLELLEDHMLKFLANLGSSISPSTRSWESMRVMVINCYLEHNPIELHLRYQSTLRNTFAVTSVLKIGLVYQLKSVSGTLNSVLGCLSIQWHWITFTNAMGFVSSGLSTDTWAKRQMSFGCQSSFS